ncbi:MAG: hypothetical protein GY715_10810 [Planctomycetes bacterium]|nr:hypothetical protein [Planctomycetota bacterium]
MRLMLDVRSVVTLAVASLASLGTASVALAQTTTTTPAPWDEQANGPLPRWREGARPAPDPEQSLVPYAITSGAGDQEPTSGVVTSPQDYTPIGGVVFRYSTGAWPGVVTDCVRTLTGDPTHDEIAYVIVASASQQSAATTQFANAGADLSKVQFIIMPSDSIWLRDYGPHFIWQSGTLAIVDSHYYPTRPNDNFSPTLLADDEFLIPSYDIGLYYSGGNFQAGVGTTGFKTALIYLDNPGFGATFIGELMDRYQGIETLHIFPQLPGSVDGTGHIDMWFYVVDSDTVVISEFLPGENATAIAITNNAATYMEGQGYEVFRVPDENAFHPNDPQCHYTYTNAYRVNDRIFIPQYGDAGPIFQARDLEAIAIWEQAAPDAEIIGINCYDIIWAAGAIHCIMMQVPRYTDSIPAAHVISPAGGELLVEGNTRNLTWAATDDSQITSVDLSYSTDGGATFPNVIATGEANDGQFDWTVPANLTDEAIVQVVAYDDSANSAAAVSEATFEITDADQSVYDFGTDFGVDRWAYGHQTGTWSEINATRYPAALSELTTGPYLAIGLSDNIPYSTIVPASAGESTHVFEFTIAEAPATILDVEILWEGYSNACAQMELYVWDNVAGNWGNGNGVTGENRYMTNYAGNIEEHLVGNLRSDFDRYIDGSGKITLLVYAERPGNRSHHDYVSVTVTHGAASIEGDVNGDGNVNFADILALIGQWGPCVGCSGDVNGDGVVSFADILLVIANWS